ncbi:hypothetical protein [Salinicola endophyticus]|uniref:hypothetical protein n=1 Tax=Salinicola endophyticus TaxID=1949083 RepID=UPI0013005206|nr:hypothetical protein [Salinicola endophyticus]
MRTMLNGFYVVQDRFFIPSADFGQPQPDIAIRELNAAFLETIEKEAIDLDCACVAAREFKACNSYRFSFTIEV